MNNIINYHITATILVILIITIVIIIIILLLLLGPPRSTSTRMRWLRGHSRSTGTYRRNLTFWHGSSQLKPFERAIGQHPRYLAMKFLWARSKKVNIYRSLFGMNIGERFIVHLIIHLVVIIVNNRGGSGWRCDKCVAALRCSLRRATPKWGTL
ncbi:hypothetical protein T492DRAFT_193513 [Pavlovales sp. CCMP2436]|nr:hypothetical protein T492DRAFT_193513 [Pavlovales sp. CCMP2436]